MTQDNTRTYIKITHPGDNFSCAVYSQGPLLLITVVKASAPGHHTYTHNQPRHLSVGGETPRMEVQQHELTRGYHVV